MTKKLSIIVPCYYEEETIPLFYEAVEKVKKELNGIELEYWFVNDGSQDGTLDEMRKLNARDKEHVHYVSFSRNFGKEAAPSSRPLPARPFWPGASRAANAGLGGPWCANAGSPENVADTERAGGKPQEPALSFQKKALD